MPVIAEEAPVERRETRVVLEPGVDLRSLAPEARIASLSPAELQVVQAMVTGLSPKEVATERGTSIATVRTQLKRAKKKAAARTLNELVALVCLAELDKKVNGADGGQKPSEP